MWYKMSSYKNHFRFTRSVENEVFNTTKKIFMPEHTYTYAHPLNYIFDVLIKKFPRVKFA